MVTHRELAPNTNQHSGSGRKERAKKKTMLAPQNNSFSISPLKKQKSAAQLRVHRSINVHACTVAYVYTLAQMLVFYWAWATMLPHCTPRTQTKTEFPLGRSLTSQLTNPYTQCLARGQRLTSKLFLSRSEAHRLVLFGCVAGDIVAIHLLRTAVVTQQPFY